MRKLIPVFAILILFTSLINAQWIAQNSGTTNSIYSSHFESAMTGWLTGSAATIRYTSNGGATWIPQTTALTFGAFQSVFFADPFTGWIVGDQYYTNTIVLKTTNSGTNWNMQSPGGTMIFYSSYFMGPSSGWIIGMNTQTYSAYIMSTSDGGTNWTERMNGGIGRLLCSNFFGTNGWAGGVNSFVRTSNSGITWDTITSAYSMNGLYFVNIVTGYMAENSGKVLKTTNSGSNWFVSFPGGFGTLKSVYFTDLSTGWACGAQGKIIKTTNSGINWYVQNTPVTSSLNSVYFITPLIGYAAGDNGVILKTTNGGEVPANTTTIHRYNINKPISGSQFTNDTVNFNSFVPSGGYTRYVKITLDSIINNVNSDLEIALVHQGITDTIAYRVGGNGSNFYNTVLNDSALTPIENGTPPYNGQYKPSRPLSQFINLSSGGLWILKIFDRAKSLTGVIKSWSITITYSPNIGINKIENTVPEKYTLYQNYPNPFNPSTNIRYQIRKNTFVSLKVFDLLGREVAALVNENLRPGIYETPFTAPENISSGIYFYNLSTEDYTETRKMVLLK
jgi:photosystem II stability/assembly factor-like uncharacterized protein